MVVTDGKEQNNSIPYRMSFKGSVSIRQGIGLRRRELLGAYNIIEPTESLENAVYKLKKQHKNWPCKYTIDNDMDKSLSLSIINYLLKPNYYGFVRTQKIKKGY